MNSPGNIPSYIKESITAFDVNEVDNMFKRLEELKQLKENEQEKEINTKYLLEETQNELKETQNKLEKLKSQKPYKEDKTVVKEDNPGLKRELETLLDKLHAFYKVIGDNNTSLNILNMQIAKSEHLLNQLEAVKNMNQEVSTK
tara:strand:+ start:5187 stop:5618 length:432 start_codon:yes stop_codon:yes gene_type:complete